MAKAAHELAEHAQRERQLARAPARPDKKPFLVVVA
jgi:hypothetical protein